SRGRADVPRRGRRHLAQPRRRPAAVQRTGTQGGPEGPRMTATYGKNWNPADHYKDDTIARGYARKRFRGLSGRLFNALEKRLIRRAFAGLAPDSVIGDVPCGTGRLAEVLLDSGFSVVGIDISPHMLAAARDRLSRFGERFRDATSDAKALAGTGHRFDAALCARVHSAASKRCPVPTRALASLVASRNRSPKRLSRSRA